NTASRMSSQGIDGTIQTTLDTFQRLKEHYAFVDRGIITVKGKGDMPTYILLDRKMAY
ncbi:adenylate/guanylate cyclase domain-containing response regulator, partial [bacterium]|nr:adenylate/guanylate cyclase domain-containing response regulator [bacterium]